MTDNTPLVEVNKLSVQLGPPRHQVQVLHDIDLSIQRGAITAVVGETGSGKTTLARSIVGLVRPSRGQVLIDGVDHAADSARARRAQRRSGAVQFIFQDSLRSLDPMFNIEQVLSEGLLAQKRERHDVAQRVHEALAQVNLDESILRRLPMQLSGGQRQRVAIARALTVEPRLLICDEPISALDASNRNTVLDLLVNLCRNSGLTVVIVSHDLGSMAGVTDRVAVLHQGRLVEDAGSAELFSNPMHPYTALLLASVPGGRFGNGASRQELRATAVNENSTSEACAYAGRCPFVTDRCLQQSPPLQQPKAGRRVACHHASEWRQTLLATADLP